MITDFVKILQRVKDAWLVCLCNEAGEMTAVFDLPLQKDAAVKRAEACARMLPGADNQSVFDMSVVFDVVSVNEMLRLLTAHDADWDADWTKATWTDLGDCGSVLSFGGIPRDAEQAWRKGA